MRESWLICVHYLGRVARKPWLVCFLLAIPFLLLLAEFAAFGRTAPMDALKPVALGVTRANLPGQAQTIFSCLANQTGHPLELVDAGQTGMDRLVLPAPAHIEFAQKTKPEDQLLEASLLKICTVSPSSPAVTVKVERGPAATQNSGDFIARFFPGLALFGAMFLGQAMASAVWRDQELAVQRRLLSFPIWRGAITTGPFLYLAIGVAVALILVLAASLFAVNLPVSRLPVLLLSALGFALFVSALQLAIGLWAGSLRAAQAVSASVSMMLAFFGGGFVPLQVYPPFLRAAAYGLPNGAAQAALSQTLLGVNSLSSLALPIATVWIWAAVALTGALLLQARKIRL